MKYTLTCGDLGNPTCTYLAEGATADEAAANMMVHAKVAHADDLAKMNMPDPAILEMMKSKTKASE